MKTNVTIATVVDAVIASDGLQCALGVAERDFDRIQRKAFELYRAERWDQAEVLLKGLLALDPRRFYPNLLLGDMERMRGNCDRAVSLLEAAHSLDPTNDVGRFKLGQALMQAGRYEEAVSVLNRVLADSEYYDGAQVLLGRAMESR